MVKEVQVNNQIKVPKVLVINYDGSNLGEMETRRALYKAREVQMDLVEVGSKNGVPVCKILDYGKLKYEQAKKNKINKPVRKQTKEIKLRPNTDNNDLSYKSRHAKEFLKEGHRVKLTVCFRGREQAHMFETGKIMLEKFLSLLEGEDFSHSDASTEGKSISIFLTSGKVKQDGETSDNRREDIKGD